MKNICFLGDSITRRGYWIAEVFEHLRKEGIRVWNCGVSGDAASRAISRLYVDCLNRSPDTVVMMFGMNDVGRDLYDEGKCGDEIEAKKATRLEKFDTSMRTLAAMLQRAGCDIILCTPTPCDDVTPGAAVVNHTNKGLAKCAELVRRLAKELNAPCVDFFDHLLPRVGGEYKTLPDRVHPTPESHHPMAQLFLKTLGFISENDLAPFLPMCEDAQARFDVEQKAREIEFIEWNQMYEERKSLQKSHAALAVLAEQRLAVARESGNELQIYWYSNYLSIVGNRQLYEDELVHRTLEMSNL
ncbi:MAG: SGNH/GDSL hydrolase family protein [Clostridia bacterium]|nr:SGNH/GDSL hydrolase family protein [Clostridia bacterium]